MSCCSVYIVVEAEDEVDRSGDDLKCHMEHRLTYHLLLSAYNCGSEAQGSLNHPDGQVEVALLCCVDNGVAVGLPVAGAAVVIQGADVDGGTAVGGTGDLEISHIIHDGVLLQYVVVCVTL